MKKSALIILILMALPITTPAETLYPSGSNILIDYNLSATEVNLGDTLTITRTFTNNESFAVNGLYFSEHIPSGFEMISYSMTLNGGNLTPVLDSSADAIYSGYRYYHWVVDDPDGSITNTIASGDNLVLTIQLVGESSGTYSFPLHTSAFVGNSSGYFATDDEYMVVVSEGLDTTPPGRITDLQ